MHLHDGRITRFIGNQVKTRHPRAKQILHQLHVRAHDSDRRARLSEQRPGRRKANLKRFHGHASATLLVAVNHGRKLDDRPDSLLQGQRHLTQLQITALGKRRLGERLCGLAAERQANGGDQQDQIEQQRQGARNTNHPHRPLGGKTQWMARRRPGKRKFWRGCG